MRGRFVFCMIFQGNPEGCNLSERLLNEPSSFIHSFNSMSHTEDAMWNDYGKLRLTMVACRDYPHNPIDTQSDPL
jgi:hypothetical protein